MPFSEFVRQLTLSPPLLWVTFLIAGTAFVNGWTDAPGAITAAVSTQALSMPRAMLLGAFFNFCGAFLMKQCNDSVASSVIHIASLIGYGPNAPVILCAALLAIILWGILAWTVGIPTSESHALIAGIVGAALACGVKVTPEAMTALRLAIGGLFLSLPVGILCGVGATKILGVVYRNLKKEKRDKTFRKGQIVGACAMAFMHGAQDGQKFMGLMTFSLWLSASPAAGGEGNSPLWITGMIAALIALGTGVGGYRIIRRVGMKTVTLTPCTGLASDMAATGCMLAATLGGIPVSTTHTATASVIGAALGERGRRGRRVNGQSLREMLAAWILTFPCCGGIAFLLVRLLLH